MGGIVRMYFIQGIPYTFDEIPQIIQDHPSVVTEALEFNHDYTLEEMAKCFEYLMLSLIHI